MRDTIATPEGTRDLLFHCARALRTAESAIRCALEDQGYSEIVTPTIEFYDMFNQANPAHAQESMLKVIDRSGRICVVRPDNTTPVARIAATRLDNAALPVRLYYSQRVFRSVQSGHGHKSEFLQMGAELIAAGVDVGDINRRIYQEVPATSFITQREVLNNMVVEENGTISHYSMPAGRKEELGVSMEDTKDLVDIIRVMQGVKVAVIFEDLENGLIRVSLRSKDPQIDVSAIAGIHGGGGHCMASGIRMRGPLSDAREKVLNSIRAVVRSLT